MELLRDSIPMVSLAVLVAAVCARAASSWLRPGLPRLVSLLPVVAFLAAAPLALSSSAIIRGLAGLFLGWLGVFKVVLLAVGRGPLDPALPVLPFVFTTALPVKLIRCCGTGAAAGAAACSRAKSVSLVSCAVKVAVIAAILHAYQYVNQLHLYSRLALYGVHMYCFFDFLLPCIAAAGGALGMEMEPQFDRPYLASSLRDFWGRRWNLTVSAILRPSVYDPVRARAGKARLTFSWPDKVPSDRETGRLFGPSGLPATHCTGAVVAGYGGAMIRPKSSRAAPGTSGSWQARDFT